MKQLVNVIQICGKIISQSDNKANIRLEAIICMYVCYYKKSNILRSTCQWLWLERVGVIIAVKLKMFTSFFSHYFSTLHFSYLLIIILPIIVTVNNVVYSKYICHLSPFVASIFHIQHYFHTQMKNCIIQFTKKSAQIFALC